MRILTLAECDATVPCVLFDDIQKPLDRLLVVIVILALNDDFLASVDELVAPLGREVLVCQEALRATPMLVREIFVLRRDTIRNRGL